jgi:hypothetical protein
MIPKVETDFRKEITRQQGSAKMPMQRGWVGTE